MASLMNELLEVLENEEAGYRELVEASTRKKEVIIKADIRALEEITAEEQEIAGKIKNHKLVIPGKVAVLKGDLEAKMPGWEIIVGPREAVQLVKFLKDMQ